MSAGEPYGFYTVDIDDPTPVLITEVEGYNPCWSPDNTKFVYRNQERRKPAMAVFDMETQESERLVSGDGAPDWRRF
jgi:Tol biopolymer transport system component